jgi:hypothetical protein
MNDLLKLSWQVQVALGSGYVAYMLAYVGIRQHHQATDITFRTISFGLLASLTLYLKPTGYIVWDSLLAFFVAVAGGLVWRYAGIGLLRRSLRHFNISWADDTPTAWATISSANSQHKLTQLSVLLQDGTWLICSPVGKFNDDPFGPCVLGQGGDLALYVTEEIEPCGKSRPQTTVKDNALGSRLTYVPAAAIKRIVMRHVDD